LNTRNRILFQIIHLRCNIIPLIIILLKPLPFSPWHQHKTIMLMLFWMNNLFLPGMVKFNSFYFVGWADLIQIALGSLRYIAADWSRYLEVLLELFRFTLDKIDFLLPRTHIANHTSIWMKMAKDGPACHFLVRRLSPSIPISLFVLFIWIIYVRQI